MGNIESFQKDKNKKQENIKLCEKRYGYNLNDLHSYIYKINLPLKPAYVKYVFEDKKEGNKKGRDKRGEDTKGTKGTKGIKQIEEKQREKQEKKQEKKQEEKQEEKQSAHQNSVDFADLYGNYEKENINNSNNIYKNKLHINRKNEKEKIEDKYIHLLYNSDYKYDPNKNNIYTEETINDYLTDKSLYSKKDFSDKKECIDKEETNDKITKSYTNLCLNYYNNLNTCVIKKYEKNTRNTKYKYTRLHTCKPHYVLFSRCIRYRDKQLLHTIKKYEWNYFYKLNKKSQSEYLNEFIGNINYHQYLIQKLYDGVEKIKLQKELNELRERYNHILKELQVDEKFPKEKFKVGKKNDQTKKKEKRLLLNI